MLDITGKPHVYNVKEDHQIRIYVNALLIACIDYTRCDELEQRYDLYIGDTMIGCVDRTK